MAEEGTVFLNNGWGAWRDWLSCFQMVQACAYVCHDVTVNLMRHGKELFKDSDVNRTHLYKTFVNTTRAHTIF